MTTRFVLYVAAGCPRGERAVENLRRLCDASGLSADDIEVVDVDQSPDRADEAGVVATPTVVAVTANARRRVMGDLSDLDRLASALDVALLEPPDDD